MSCPEAVSEGGGASVVICAYMRILYVRACVPYPLLAVEYVFSLFLREKPKIVRHQPGHSTDNERACMWFW